MRVLVIPSWYPPNGGWFFKEHAMAVAATGPQVDVMAGIYTSIRKTNPLKWISKDRIIIKKEDNIREIIKRYPIIPFSEKLNYHGWVRMMLLFYDQYHRQFGHPDIIQVHSSLWAGVVASQIYKRYKIPYVITEHRSRFVGNSAEALNMFRPWYTGPLQEAFKGAAAIISVSPALHAKIIEIHPKAGAKLDVIFNMVDTNFFTPPAGKVREKRPFRLFSLAYLEPVKGMDTLLEALKICNESFPGDFELTIGGDGTERRYLEKFCVDHKLVNQVRFTGILNREQVRQAMQSADAFVLPSRFEAFGVVYIEAMACGLPVIATRAGGPESFVKPGTGLLIEPNNPEELAKAIYHIKTNLNDYPSQFIRDYAEENFSRKGIAEKYIALYKKILRCKK
jgi:L-malate glycosyltransferase